MHLFDTTSELCVDARTFAVMAALLVAHALGWLLGRLTRRR